MDAFLGLISTILSYISLLSASDDRVFLPIVHYEMPPQCPAHELYMHCLTECSDCDHRGHCLTPRCVGQGCGCIMHYVRLDPGGSCQPVALCPKPECKENEEFRECGPAFESCRPVHCRILHCEFRCYCREGFMRSADNKCIPKSDCPPKTKCSRTEEKRTSGLVNEFCIPGDQDETNNSTQEVEMCYCKPDHKRNQMGHCVLDTFCHDLKCPNLMEHQHCPKKCNTTCRGYGDPSCEENGDCFPGCFCPEGLLMDDDHHCVPLEACPPGSNPFAPTAAPTTEGVMTTGYFDLSTSSPLTPDDTFVSRVTAASSTVEPEKDASTVLTSAEPYSTTPEEIIEDSEDSEDVPASDFLVTVTKDVDVAVTEEAVPTGSPTKPKVPKSRRNKGAQNFQTAEAKASATAVIRESRSKKTKSTNQESQVDEDENI